MTPDGSYGRQEILELPFGEFTYQRITNVDLNDPNYAFTSTMKPFDFPIWAKRNGDEYIKLVIEATEFAISKYARRGWSEEFKVSLIAKAIKNAINSSYIIIRRNGKIVGTMRLTYSPYQILTKRNDPTSKIITKFGAFPDGHLEEWLRNPTPPAELPAESIVGELDRPGMLVLQGHEWLPFAEAKFKGSARDRDLHMSMLKEYFMSVGVIIEPATFAIEETLSSGQASQVFARLVEGLSHAALMYELRFGDLQAGGSIEANRQALPFTLAGNRDILNTYGDKLSVRFYERLGYHEVPTRPEFQGRGWQKLACSPPQFIAALRKVSQRMSEGGVKIDELIELLERFSI